MTGGFLLLFTEIRFEHRAVLIDDWRPWIPLIFCGLMLMVIPTASVLWERGGKSTLLGCYCLTVCLGVLGLYFHSEGHLLPRLIELFTVWSSNLQTGAAIKALHPPLLAPAAFIGLGSIGFLFCISENQDIGDKLKVVSWNT